MPENHTITHCMRTAVLLSVITFAAIRARAQQQVFAGRSVARVGWTQSYDAGYTDANGAYAGGSEIMHLADHKGKLYAANGYWEDSRWADRTYEQRQSAQVLRLDSSDGRWQVDLDLGKANGQGLRYMKGNILKSLTFTRDAQGRRLERPRDFLLMASGAYKGEDGIVSAWVRDDADGTWEHSIVMRGSRANGSRWVPRDVEVYRDKVTGQDRVFLLLGNPGIVSGVHDSAQPTGIRWDKEAEFPVSGIFGTRPLGIVEANGSLLFSVGGVIYRRVDGPKPAYVPVVKLGGDVNTDLGGIRGMTAIPGPKGKGESVLFLWVPRGRSVGQVKRLDPDASGGYTVHDEASMSDLMSKELGIGVRGTLGGYNNLFPLTHPRTGKTVHIIGFQGTLQDREELWWKGTRYYAGAMYAIRYPDRTYIVHEVNGRYAPGNPVLVSPRTFAQSPFADKLLFVGGNDANFKRSDDMAWVFKAPLDVVLGLDGK